MALIMLVLVNICLSVCVLFKENIKEACCKTACVEGSMYKLHTQPDTQPDGESSRRSPEANGHDAPEDTHL